MNSPLAGEPEPRAKDDAAITAIGEDPMAATAEDLPNRCRDALRVLDEATYLLGLTEPDVAAALARELVPVVGVLGDAAVEGGYPTRRPWDNRIRILRSVERQARLEAYDGLDEFNAAWPERGREGEVEA